VLTNGNVYVCGGEYGTGSNKSEIYNSLTNTWTEGPNSQITVTFIDAMSMLLPDGTVLDASPGTGHQIYNPFTNSFGPAFNSLRGMDEVDWAKLPDDSLIAVDGTSGTTSERYIPSLGKWVADAGTPTTLWGWGGEMGTANLLPNGKVFVIGGPGNTAIYTPTGNSNPGSWATGPSFPAGIGAIDTPAAALVTGNVLCLVGPNGSFDGPASFYEYNYASNTLTPVNGPTGATDNTSPYVTSMLDLPDGSVMYQSSTGLYFYQPSGTPLAQGKPVINAITQNGNGSFHLVGTGLNGISQGARYGDDKQMDSNYPIVRLTNTANGNVYYARTFNWSSTSVMTGSRSLSTEFTLPAGLPNGTYSLVAVANGNPSASMTFTVPFTTSIIPNGVHTLTPACALSERLDDSNSGTANGNPVQLWQQNGANSQKWNFANIGGATYNVAVGLGAYCLDDMGGAQGTQAAVWACNGGTNQKWTASSVTSGYQLTNAAGLCLDVNAAGSTNGIKVQSWACNGTNAQTWKTDYTVSTIANGVHTLAPACATGSRLDDNAAGTANGNKIQIWQANGTQAQNWNFTNVGGTTFSIAVNLGPYCLDGGAATLSTATQLWSCNGTADQKWTANSVTGGYTLSSVQSGLCLDVRAAAAANGTVVQSYTCNGTNAQTWSVN